MLSEPIPVEPPRPRRSAPPVGITESRILFGIASPIIPALEHQWPSWLAPIGGGWKSNASRSGSSRRSV